MAEEDTRTYAALLRLEGKMDSVVSTVAQKADVSLVHAVDNRVARIEVEAENRRRASHRNANEIAAVKLSVDALDRKTASQEAVDRYRKWFLGGGGLVGVVAILQVLYLVKDATS